MKERSSELRWGVERRLEFIEFRLYWEGRINRSDLIEFFGVSVPQASKDLSQYQELAPGNIVYDKSGKRYLAADTFTPRFFTPDPDRYLSQLRLIAEQVISAEETWLLTSPNVDLMPIPHRRVDPSVLKSLVSAIREQRAAEIHYQSMNPKRPEPIWRGIVPHAFGSDGFRWHVRAYCHIEGKFKDFLLSRCLNCRITDNAEYTGEDDWLWQNFFEVLLEPNPKLAKSQRNIIANDYAMSNNKINIPVRRALLYYFQKRLRLDVADVLDDPNEVPLIIANKDAFNEALAAAKEGRKVRETP